MPFTSFTRDDQMLANELIHQIEMPVSNAVASLMVRELGDPSFRSKLTSAWYARAHLNDGFIYPADHKVVPFALRWDNNGNATVVVSVGRLEDLSECFRHIITGLEIVELPRGRVNRAA